MAAQFKDHFSAHAGEYAKYRPHYPAALFAKLAAVAPGRNLAWDCATGNGQAALALAEHFDRIIATDASAEQIGHAVPHAKIDYRVAAAERSALTSESADLITVGQALHWFDLANFYAEAKRVLKPQGVIAAWCYSSRITSAEIDAVIDRFYHDIVGPYWPPERALVDDGYRALEFPFEPIAFGDFQAAVEWNLEGLLGYLGTWSASRRYLAQKQSDPRDEIESDLRAAWGDVNIRRRIAWPLHLLVGRNS